MSIKSLVLPVVVASALVGCGYGTTTTTTTTSPSTSAAATYDYGSGAPSTTSSSTTSASSASATASSSAVLTTETSTTNDKYLADGSGKTLYIYDQDKTGVSNCASSCLASWPAYAAASSTASLPTNVTVITRSDGSKQYAYKGMPLYYYAGDTQAGAASGNGLGGFKLVTP